VCLSDYTAFHRRIRRPDVPVIALRKRAGHDLRTHAAFFRVVRTLRPAIVHTRNLAALEYAIVAALAGCSARIHGEHGRDVGDLDGQNAKYNLLRRAVRPLIHHYIATSQDLAGWLTHTLGVPGGRVAQIYNGVDVARFHPRSVSAARIGPPGFAQPGSFVVGTVGRMEPVKDPLTLVRAFLHLVGSDPDARRRLRLVMIGEGTQRARALALLREGGVPDLAWLPGERADIAALIRELDLFVLPSLREGVSNTILEAMASGLAVVATRVGGNPELVTEGETGTLVPPSDPHGLAGGIRSYVDAPARAARHGAAARRTVEARFGLGRMVDSYVAVYDAVLTAHPPARRVRARWREGGGTMGSAAVPGVGSSQAGRTGQHSPGDCGALDDLARDPSGAGPWSGGPREAHGAW
jgi:sugar transferase (PEP-CTERM/EpsH1 system associated)